jgi:hypothetical protein
MSLAERSAARTAVSTGETARQHNTVLRLASAAHGRRLRCPFEVPLVMAFIVAFTMMAAFSGLVRHFPE